MSTAFAILTALALVGQAGNPDRREREPDPNEPPAKPITDSFQPDSAWKSLGKDIWFDPKDKRLVLRGRVALRDGTLEHLLCLARTKEHESILATDAPPKAIHAGLLLTGATAGHPVRFEPKFETPTGSPIAIELEWEQDGKARKVDAREWVKDQANGKALARDWVFAGSDLFEDPRSKAMIYAADDGDLITVANFPSSILDLPYRSSANDGDRSYVAFTDRIPHRGTPVTLYLKPRPDPPKSVPKHEPEKSAR
jgi:hypothetical protein